MAPGNKTIERAVTLMYSSSPSEFILIVNAYILLNYHLHSYGTRINCVCISFPTTHTVLAMPALYMHATLAQPVGDCT